MYKYTFSYKLLIVLLFLICANGVYASVPTDSILKVFSEELSNRHNYYQEKENVMERMKQQLHQTSEPDAMFALNNRLFNEYIVYQYDSAWVYAQRTLSIASGLNNDDLIAESNLNVFKSLVFAGLYKEAFEMINKLEPQHIPENLKKDYYQNSLRFYRDLLMYSRSDQFQEVYEEKVLNHLDSLMAYLQPNTFEYDYYNVLYCTDVHTEIEKYREILDKYQLSAHNHAIVYSNLSISYRKIDDIDQAVYFAALSAIYDIRASIRETISKHNLGEWLYELGNIDFASKCMQAAMEDAMFYDSRSRKIEISAFLPIIEQERHAVVKGQKDKLTTLLIVTSLLALVTLLMLIIILRQIKKLKTANQSIQLQYDEIRLINSKLEEINKELQRSKEMLEESNEIKDMYVIQSLYGRSDYIERFESLLRTIDRKVKTRQYDDLSKLYKEFNLKSERENMYSAFDKTFLLLFPNFIDDFNKLFNPEDQMKVDKESGLNTELRIFALMRLGITDYDKIAKFLNLSVKTVYSYRAKIKSKTIIPKEEFEYRVCRIQKTNKRWNMLPLILKI